MDKLNGWLGLLANLGVIAGLVILVLEVQQSNRIALGSAESDWSLQASEVNRSVVDNETTGTLAGKLSSRETDLTVTEAAQAKFFVRQFNNLWSSAESLHSRGLMSDSYYEGALVDVAVTMDELPGLVPYFASIGRAYGVSYDGSRLFNAYCSAYVKHGFTAEAAEGGCPGVK